MSELDYRNNLNERELPGMMCRCRWHGYYDLKTGCEMCRKQEAKQQMAERQRRLPDIFNNVIWLK